MSMVPEVMQAMNHAIGKGNAQRKSTYDIVQKNPAEHINSWAKGMSRADVEEAERSEHCQQFFKLYPTYYVPVGKLP